MVSLNPFIFFFFFFRSFIVNQLYPAWQNLKVIILFHGKVHFYGNVLTRKSGEGGFRMLIYLINDVRK